VATILLLARSEVSSRERLNLHIENAITAWFERAEAEENPRFITIDPLLGNLPVLDSEAAGGRQKRGWIMESVYDVPPCVVIPGGALEIKPRRRNRRSLKAGLHMNLFSFALPVTLRATCTFTL
jgi:hypothetical protein